MRRKEGVVLPLERSILEAGWELTSHGEPEFHGYFIARCIKEREGARRLTAHGTLYKALERMERAGLLESRWEDPVEAAHKRRPPRRLYRITGAGVRELADGGIPSALEALDLQSGVA